MGVKKDLKKICYIWWILKCDLKLILYMFISCVDFSTSFSISFLSLIFYVGFRPFEISATCVNVSFVVVLFQFMFRQSLKGKILTQDPKAQIFSIEETDFFQRNRRQRQKTNMRDIRGGRREREQGKGGRDICLRVSKDSLWLERRQMPYRI